MLLEDPVRQLGINPEGVIFARKTGLIDVKATDEAEYTASLLNGLMPVRYRHVAK
jgi:hypothetical protein